MEANMILIMIDECGSEIEYARYRVGQFIEDEDEFEIWKERKIAKAWNEYPEARGFYWEDRRDWNHLINMMIHDAWDDDFEDEEDC